LYWEGKRVVLRGIRVNELTAAMLSDARAAEVALIVPNPTLEQCRQADMLGVSLIADLREADADINDILRLSNHPSIAIVLIDGHQVLACDLHRIPTELNLGVAMYPDDYPGIPVKSPPTWADIIVVELNAGSLPPTWLTNSGKPVIAIREKGTYADLQMGRVACEHLQAGLAPEFDLAGYFV
jgi:hypothetical protein